MIIYLLLKGFDVLVYGIISLIPTFETPAWVATQLPDVLTRVASFNWYLPISETVTIILGLIAFTLAYKVFKVVMNMANIDLNS